jgi:type IV pilus assembly protein PilC
MPTYSYTAQNSTGKSIKGTVNAANPNEVVTILRKQDLTVVNVQEATTADIKSSSPRGKVKAKVKTKELVVFTRQLATMISAGIPLMECLEILQEQQENLGFAAVLKRVVEDVRSGTDFSQALSYHPNVFSNIYVAMIRAGEASGQLDEICTRLSEFMEAAQKLKAEIKSAMTYPVISLALVLGITLFLMIGIIPKFKSIFDAMEVELPWITDTLMKISFAMKDHFLEGIAGAVVAFFALKFFLKTPTGNRLKDRLLLTMPVFGPLFSKVALSRFSRTFATLIQAGVPILGALEIVAATSGNVLMEEAVLSARDSVRQGETLGEPLAEHWVFPPMVTRMISIGEKSGALESLLEKISEFYDNEVHVAVESLTSLIEPIMIGIMGIVVGGIVLAVFLPIFKLQDKLAG